MVKPKFSVVLIAKNEERTLPKMLSSLAEFQVRGGEVIVLDTGSTDNTVVEAQVRGCVVREVGDRFVTTISEAKAKQVNRKFTVSPEQPILTSLLLEPLTLFDYSTARNYAATLASSDMVAMPDCDEAFTKLDLDAIDGAIDDGARRLEYNFVFAHDQFGGEAVKFLHSKFYDRTRFKWVGVVHEVLIPLTGLDDGSPDSHKTLFLDESHLKLDHWQNHFTDRSGYLRGLALDCFENPQNDRNSHYLGRELLYKGRPKSAIQELNRHINMGAWPAERAQSMVYIGDAYLQLGKEQLGLQMYHKAFLLSPSRGPLMRLAKYFWGRDDYQRAAVYANAALMVPYSGFYASDMDEYRHLPREILYWAMWHFYWDTKDEQYKNKSKEHWLKALRYLPLSPKFINDGQFYIDPPLGLESFTKYIEGGNNFSYIKLGDGEEMCMRGEQGQNCDGQSYSRELGQRLTESFSWLVGRPNVHVRHWSDQAGVNLLLHRVGSDNNAVKRFWLAVRNRKCGKVLVAPARLKWLKLLLNVTQFIEVPETNAFDSYEGIRERLLADPHDLNIFCAGPMAKVLIADVLRQDSDTTCIDAGSSFDSLFTGRQTRTEQLPHNEMVALYASELGEDNMPMVSICIPTLGREEQLAKLVAAIHANAKYPAYEVVIEYDSFEDRQGCPRTLAKAVVRASGDLIMYLGNDCMPGPGFLRSAVRTHLLTFCGRPGLVALNDGYWDPSTIATHWLASRSLLPLIGGEFFYTGYNHLGCDNELTARCKALGKYAWDIHSKLIHHHPVQMGWDSMDEVHQLAWNPDSVIYDRSLLKDRLADLGLEFEEPQIQSK